MKPVVGVLSDLFALGGYNKRYWVTSSILVGVEGCAVLLGTYRRAVGALEEESSPSSSSAAARTLADAIVACFAAVSFEASSLDVLGEGKYSELMRRNPESGSSVISFKYGLSSLGIMVTNAYVGPLADAGHFHALYWVAMFLSLAPLLPTLAGWIPERIRSAAEPGMVKLCPGCLFDRGSFVEKRTLFIVITLCGLSGPVLTAVTTFADLTIGLSISAAFIVAFTVGTYFIFPRSVSSITWIHFNNMHRPPQHFSLHIPLPLSTTCVSFFGYS